MKKTDNTILLTGGTSGIGKALLQKFYGLGNHVIVVSGNSKNLEELQIEFPEIVTFKCDLSKQIEVAELIRQCKEHHPDINLLINNAGIQYNYRLDEETYPNSLIEKELRINLLSPIEIIQGLIPILVTKSNAAIINVSSILAIVPKQSAPVYCASKAGLHIFTKALRYQLEDSKIKVFEILPPLVDTPMTEGRGTGKISPEQLVEEFMSKFSRDQFEISIGKARTLRYLRRLSPALADNILKKN